MPLRALCNQYMMPAPWHSGHPSSRQRPARDHSTDCEGAGYCGTAPPIRIYAHLLATAPPLGPLPVAFDHTVVTSAHVATPSQVAYLAYIPHVPRPLRDPSVRVICLDMPVPEAFCRVTRNQYPRFTSYITLRGPHEDFTLRFRG